MSWETQFLSDTLRLTNPLYRCDILESESHFTTTDTFLLLRLSTFSLCANHWSSLIWLSLEKETNYLYRHYVTQCTWPKVCHKMWTIRKQDFVVSLAQLVNNCNLSKDHFILRKLLIKLNHVPHRQHKKLSSSTLFYQLVDSSHHW